MENFPPFPFLRFDAIIPFISFPDFFENEKAWDTQSIDAKCQFFEDQLKLIKPALDDTNLCFHGQVDENNSSCFADHSDFLNYFRNRILPMFHKVRGYLISIILHSDNGVGKFVLSSLLQMQEIDRSSEVKIYIRNTVQKLPVAEISLWLHRRRAEQRKRSLTLVFFAIESIVGIEEMLIHLKAVLS